jgi:hypothetical protein
VELLLIELVLVRLVEAVLHKQVNKDHNHHQDQIMVQAVGLVGRALQTILHFLQPLTQVGAAVLPAVAVDLAVADQQLVNLQPVIQVKQTQAVAVEVLHKINLWLFLYKVMVQEDQVVLVL